MRIRPILSSALVLACAGFPLGGGAAFGYAGEPGSGDGPNAALLNLSLSTHHTHLTRALAYCAGFPGLVDVRNPVNPLLAEQQAELAEKIGLYDELTDQGTISDKDANGNPVAPIWTNITPKDQWSYVPPTLSCGSGLTMLYPIVRGSQPPNLPPDAFWEPTEGWFTNRFSPWATQFHFPDNDGFADDLDVLHDFAMGTSPELVARSVYAYGSSTANMWTASCYPEPVKMTLKTGNMTSGSVMALGAYLHALGDRHSHGICETGTHSTPPWYYHNFYTTEHPVDGCGFTSHALEFGCPDTKQEASFITNTIGGGVAVFNALREYAAAKYPAYTPRISSVDDHGKWLRRQIERYAILFKTSTSPQGGACRVSFTHALMKACTNAINTNPASCLPDVRVDDSPGCELAGQEDESCKEGTTHYQVTPACTSSSAAQATAAP